MFLGTHPLRLDDKGRLMLPSKFRDKLTAGLVLTKGQERCLYVWPSAEFDRFTSQMKEAPVTDKAVRDYMRVLFASAYDDELDRQGRITIPPPLRDYARLDRNCIVNGANTRAEIWEDKAWKAYLAETEESFARMSEEFDYPI